MAMEPSLADVVEACQRGDRGAQRLLYEQSSQSVYRLMVRMVGEQEADDLTQQVFLQAFRKLGQFSGRSKFSTWLYRLAVNEALQHLRRSRRSKHASLEHEPGDMAVDHGETLQLSELLQLALDRLEPDLRAIFLLKEVEELAYGDIAVALNIPEGTVGSRLNRARRMLQAILSELGWEP